MSLLTSLEQSGFSVWVRESRSLLAFPGILLLHTYGMAFLVGVVFAIDLRILGFAPALPVTAIGRFLPILWVAFWVNAITGTMLLAADAVNKMTNPDFWVKMIFIVLAVIAQRMIERRVIRAPATVTTRLSSPARMLAVASLVCWIGAITAGRLLAYVGQAVGPK